LTREKVSSRVFGTPEERRKRKAQEERIKEARLRGETRGALSKAYWTGYYKERYPHPSMLETFGISRLLGDRGYRPRYRSSRAARGRPRRLHGKSYVPKREWKKIRRGSDLIQVWPFDLNDPSTFSW
jgi:hypothetical protein